MMLSVMAFNCSHGSTITTVPEAWKLNWADTIDIAQAVDRPGMDQCCLKVAPPTFRNLILCELSHIGHYANHGMAKVLRFTVTSQSEYLANDPDCRYQRNPSQVLDEAENRNR